MTKTTVYLPPELKRALRRVAARCSDCCLSTRELVSRDGIEPFQRLFPTY